ncbi:MAG TPA: HAD-IB family hydrolase [Candidatus Thermoplasmatota archaeon]|nr:HAD-IB family hydrolase [Candidatus Thermoplasmatota archaeon]
MDAAPPVKVEELPRQPQAAAFFDFDHTLLDGDAGVIFATTLLAWGFERGNNLKGAERRRHYVATSAQIAGNVGKGMFYRSLNALGIMKRSELIERLYRMLKDMPAAEMSRRMERAWNERIRQRLYPDMVRLLEEHRKAGRRIVIVTTGMKELVLHARKALGEDVEVIGVEMHARDGLWLGSVEGPLYGVHKADAVRAWAVQNNVDLAQSYAYSDHFSDAAFLALVGHPVAVNPDLRLRLYARKKGWRTLNVLPPHRGG